MTYLYSVLCIVNEQMLLNIANVNLTPDVCEIF